MSRRVPPQPATRDEVRARYHGLDDHVRSTGVEAAWLGLQAVALAVAGVLLREATGTRIAAFVAAGVLLAAAIGIARAVEWSRWVGGIASLLLAAYGLAQPFLPRSSGGAGGQPKYFVVLIGLSTGIYLLLPSTRVAFRNARENRERVRAAKAAV